MATIDNYIRTVNTGFQVGTDLVNLNKDINAAASGKGTASIQFLAMKLAMMMIGASQDRLATPLKDATGNLNKLTAMNQLKEDTTKLKGLRTNGGLADGKTMEANAADTKAFIDKAKQAGIAVSADEYTNFSSGKVTQADLDTMESRIKTQQDAASNSSQADNMKMQQLNTLIGQFTNMGMTFLDEHKKAGERIFR